MGLHYLNNRSTYREVDSAAAYFSRAVARDPQYARGYAGRALALLLLFEYAPTFDSTLISAGRAAALKALSLDSTLAPGHLALGYAYKSYDWDWRAAEREYRTAIALDPNLATAHQWLGELLMDQRRLPESRREVDAALTLDPAAPVPRLVEGQYYEAVGFLDSAAAAYRRGTEINQGFLGYLEGGMLAVYLGHYDDARAQFRRAAALAADSTAAFLPLVDGVERPAARRAAIRAVEAQLASRPATIVLVARQLALLDDRERAITLLERAVQQRAPFITYIGRSAELRPLDADPRYQAILKRIGLPLPQQDAPRPRVG